MPGPQELIVIALICTLLFGASQIPKLARSLGRARKEFEDGAKEGLVADDDTPSANAAPKVNASDKGASDGAS